MRGGRCAALIGALMLLTTACLAEPSPSVTPTSTASSTPVATASAPEATASASSSASAPASASPTATPEPPLSLDLPETTDSRVVSVAVAPELAADGGRIVVRVTSAAEERIDELVLRWPTELADTLFLQPFIPSEERTRDGGDPLVQPWTKWVVGPGERGEPAGTTSLGWGPLLAGATLEIPILVERRAAGPVAFDLQVLAGNDLLLLESGEPAELRVEVP